MNVKVIRSSSSLPMALAAASAGVCAGWAIAWMFFSAPVSGSTASQTVATVSGSLFDPAAGPPAACTSVQEAAAPSVAEPGTLNQALGKLTQQMKAGGSGDLSASISRLINGAQSDPVLRSDIIRRYRGERDEAALGALAAVISSFPPQEIRDMTLQLAQGDASQRASAFRLLAASPGSSAVGLPIIQQALNTEQDAHVLSQAVSALGSQPSLDPVQTQAALARLNALAENPDPDVRSESLRVLAQWDKTGAVAEPQLYKALSADNPEVRAEAVNAVGGSALRSDRMKAALLSIVGNNAESPDARVAALQALEHFSLTPQEYAFHSQLSAALASRG